MSCPVSKITDVIGEEKIISRPACETIYSLSAEANPYGLLLSPQPLPCHSVSPLQTGSSYHPEPFLTGSSYDTGSSSSSSPCCELRALRGVDTPKYCIVVQEVQRSSWPFCLLSHCLSLSYGLHLFIPQLYLVRLGGIV